jgi:hypothetical protein
LAGGDMVAVRQKCVSDFDIPRTPLFVFCNQEHDMMTNLVFKERVVTHRWKKAEILCGINQYPYPLAFFQLLLNYNIDF